MTYLYLNKLASLTVLTFVKHCHIHPVMELLEEAEDQAAVFQLSLQESQVCL